MGHVLTFFQSQARRILFVCGMGSLGSILIAGPTAMAAGLAIGAIWLVIFLCYTMPRLRTASESIALGLFLTGLLPVPNHVVPASLVGLSFLSHWLLYGPWADRLVPGISLIVDRQATIAGRPDEIWSALIPAASTRDRYWNNALVDFCADPDDEDTTYLRFKQPSGLMDEVTLTFLEVIPGKYCKFMLERGEFHDRNDVTLAITIDQTGPRECRVSSHLEQHDLPPRMAFARWFDNCPDDKIDGLAVARNIAQSHVKWTMFFGRTPVHSA